MQKENWLLLLKWVITVALVGNPILPTQTLRERLAEAERNTEAHVAAMAQKEAQILTLREQFDAERARMRAQLAKVEEGVPPC